MKKTRQAKLKNELKGSPKPILTRPLKIGTKFPDIEFITTNNDSISLINFKGKYTNILFWNTWCDSCKIALQRFYDRAIKDKSQQFITVCINNHQASWLEEINTLPRIPQLTHLYTSRYREAIVKRMMQNKNFPEKATFLLLDASSKVVELPKGF